VRIPIARPAVAALAAAIAVLACAAPVSAAPIWLATEDLTPAGSLAAPEVAFDPVGNAAAVWTKSVTGGRSVQASFRPAGGAWGAPVDVSSLTQYANAPQVALDAAGNAVAAWSTDGGLAQASVRPAATGVWGPPQDLSLSGTPLVSVHLAVDPAGDAVAVWQRSNGTNNIVQAAARPAATGVWEPAKDLSAVGADGIDPQVAIDASGIATAVWRRSNGTNYILQASRRAATATGGWSSPADDLSAIGQSAGFPGVAVNAAGDGVAVWNRSNGTNSIIQAAVRPASTGVWGSPQDLSAIGQSAFTPQVAIDAAGNAIAVWERTNASAIPTVQASRRSAASGVWGTPQDLSSGIAGESSFNPQVAVDPAGDAVAVWQRSNLIVQASARPALTGVWSMRQDLSLGPNQSLGQQVAMDAAGNAVAVWRRGNNPFVIQAAGYDAAGPVFGALTVPATATVGVPVGFSTTPFDVWSAPVGAPLWNFGDGAAASGPSVSHAYAAAGTYSVTISQADAFGNASAATRSIAVTPPPPPPPPNCVVPKVVGKTLRKAKSALKARHCKTGTVRRAYSAKVKKGRVLRQRPKAGKQLANGAKVNLVVSRGKRR
jgi:PASTA domain-containing protein/PKD domain-containing protein